MTEEHRFDSKVDIRWSADHYSDKLLAWGIGLLGPGTAMLVYSLFPGKLKFGG